MATIIRIKSRQAEKLHDHAKKACMYMKKLMKYIEESVPLDEDEEFDERDDDDFNDDEAEDVMMNRRGGNGGGGQGTGRYGKSRYGGRNN